MTQKSEYLGQYKHQKTKQEPSTSKSNSKSKHNFRMSTWPLTLQPCAKCETSYSFTWASPLGLSAAWGIVAQPGHHNCENRSCLAHPAGRRDHPPHKLHAWAAAQHSNFHLPWRCSPNRLKWRPVATLALQCDPLLRYGVQQLLALTGTMQLQKPEVAKTSGAWLWHGCPPKGTSERPA